MTPQAPTTPDSVVVPVEPTEAMIDAYFDTCRRHGFRAHINATAAWTAMIAALPAATPGGEREAVERVRGYVSHATELEQGAALVATSDLRAILSALSRPAPVVDSVLQDSRITEMAAPVAGEAEHATVPGREHIDRHAYALFPQDDLSSRNSRLAFRLGYRQAEDDATPEPAAARGGEDAKGYVDRLVALLAPDQGDGDLEAFGLALRIQSALSAKGGS